MKIVIAPQAFKGSISALRAAEMMAEGVRRVSPDAHIEMAPVADGGDGTLETLVEASGGEIRSSDVMGPLGETRTAVWGAMGDGLTAVIEMARTSGPRAGGRRRPQPAGGHDVRPRAGHTRRSRLRVPAIHPGHRRQRHERRGRRHGPGAGRAG